MKNDYMISHIFSANTMLVQWMIRQKAAILAKSAELIKAGSAMDAVSFAANHLSGAVSSSLGFDRIMKVLQRLDLDIEGKVNEMAAKTPIAAPPTQQQPVSPIPVPSWIPEAEPEQLPISDIQWIQQREPLRQLLEYFHDRGAAQFSSKNFNVVDAAKRYYEYDLMKFRQFGFSLCLEVVLIYHKFLVILVQLQF